MLTNDKEMIFLGICFGVTQAPKKGGINSAFDVCSDGLFPAHDMGKFGLKKWHFRAFFLIGYILK